MCDYSNYSTKADRYGNISSTGDNTPSVAINLMIMRIVTTTIMYLFTVTEGSDVLCIVSVAISYL